MSYECLILMFACTFWDGGMVGWERFFFNFFIPSLEFVPGGYVIYNIGLLESCSLKTNITIKIGQLYLAWNL